MTTLVQILDKIKTVSLYWDSAESEKKYPQKKTSDLISILVGLTYLKRHFQCR